MTIDESIIEAARTLLGTDLDASFQSGELREICGIAQGSFSPILKGMRTDPGTAPVVNERARGFFIRLARDRYQLSAKGKATIGASSATPFASPLEIKARDSLEEGGYWTAADESGTRRLVEVLQRKGQPAFRERLLSAYKSRCAISQCDAVQALEAAHISPYSETQSNVTRNGLLLRADLHTLFDLDLFAIEPSTLSVRLSRKLMCTSYAPLHMTSIAQPEAQDDAPDREALSLRWSRFLLSEADGGLPRIEA